MGIANPILDSFLKTLKFQQNFIRVTGGSTNPADSATRHDTL
jgi:hypothetical protein